MFQNNPFYWGTIHKVVIAFGAVFSDIHIIRKDKNGNTVQTIEVPCNFAPAEKWMRKNKQNPNPGVDDQVEMVLPRMSYEITGFTYDAERQLPPTGRTVSAIVENNKVLKSQFNPVPYNIAFTVNIMTKTVEDSLMIVEQILPFFTPDYTITVKDIPELDLSKDLVIVLGGMEYEDLYQGSLNDRRTIIWTLNFTVKAYLYPPVNVTKVNLRTNIKWRLTTNFSDTTVISQNDQFDHTPGSTPGNVKVIQSIVQNTFQEIRGNAYIDNRTKNLLGVTKIVIPNPLTTEMNIGGVTSIRNPLTFEPGFEQAPLQTLDDGPTIVPGEKISMWRIQAQSGVCSVAYEAVQTVTGTTNVVRPTIQKDAFQSDTFQP